MIIFNENKDEFSKTKQEHGNQNEGQKTGKKDGQISNESGA